VLGKVGGRATRAAVGDKESQEAGKISKSKGAAPFRELLAQFAPEVIRFFILSTHYRRPIDFSEGRIAEVQTGLEGFYRFFRRYARIAGQSFYQIAAPTRRADAQYDFTAHPMLADVARHRDRFLEAMDDDFNTGGAIGDLFELLRRLNKFTDDEKLEEQPRPEALAALRTGAMVLKELGATVGLFRQAPAEKDAGGDQLVGSLIELLIQLRTDSRKAKNFAAADKIRNSLAGLGIVLEDRPGGTVWSRK